mmetsp:Transcript_74058/g.146768  ORF Transcript_74058/g.146768 Transcript_74058/m.146768 type:complete len:99 (+) Transcript_74058:51-347(+)
MHACMHAFHGGRRHDSTGAALQLQRQRKTISGGKEHEALALQPLKHDAELPSEGHIAARHWHCSFGMEMLTYPQKQHQAQQHHNFGFCAQTQDCSLWM